jgi:hypothetical protein
LDLGWWFRVPKCLGQPEDHLIRRNIQCLGEVSAVRANPRRYPVFAAFDSVEKDGSAVETRNDSRHLEMGIGLLVDYDKDACPVGFG